MSGRLVVGLDQGTSSTRCVILDEELNEVDAAQVPVECSFPGPGLVEQDPEALAASAAEAIAATGARPAEVAALGIANQTETFVVWDRATGRAVHPAIVWQDRRTADACDTLRDREAEVRDRTGLELDATFPATKLRWVLDRAQTDDLAYGDIASWLLHRLTNTHVTDPCNAGRSLLCPLGGDDWDDELLALFGIPREILPPIVDSDAIEAETRDGIRVAAATGDQQASLFGLRCWEPGSAKVTLGTGAFVLAQAGDTAPRPPDGILASTAWRRAATTSFALEGFIPTAGAAVAWFARLGALPRGAELDTLLHDSRPGVMCVPALQGLGSPTWDAGARGAVLGLSLSTTRADLARAVVEGVLHQVADAVEAIGGLDTVRVDGGLSRSPWIVRRLADLAAVRVERTARADSTALGAATLAGLAAGVWDDPAALPEIPVDLVAEPDPDPAERERWAEARELTRSAVRR